MKIRQYAVRIAIVMALGAMGLMAVGCGRSPSPAPVATSTTKAPVVVTATAMPNPSPTPTEIPATPAPTAVTPVQGNALNLIQSFIDAPFRVVAIAKSPLAPYTLIVATERSAAECGSPEAPARCTSDDVCGSIYSSPTCYFFVEPSYDAAADPATRYVGRWPEEPTVSALVNDSFRFIDLRTVEFKAAGGDGAYSVEEVWWLDLVTGALAMQSRVENISPDG